MKCQNCGKKEANVKYTQIINGEKKQYILCEECAEKLGINNKMSFNMDMNLGNFFGEFFDDYKENQTLLDEFIKPQELICDKCGMTYNEFINLGKFGCENCYNVFSKKLDGVLKNIQGFSMHTGRKGKKLTKKVDYKNSKEKEEKPKENKQVAKLEELKKFVDYAIPRSRTAGYKS